jgi:hypothetical protein
LLTVFNADKGVDLDIATLKADYNRMLQEAEAKARAEREALAAKKAAQEKERAEKQAAAEEKREEERLRKEKEAAAEAAQGGAAAAAAAEAKAKAEHKAEVQKVVGSGKHLALLASECEDALSAEECVAYVRQPMG